VHLPPGEALVSCDSGLKGEPRLNLMLASGGLAGLRLCIDFRWEDGEPVKSCLEAPDRWQTQAAERVTIEIAPDKLVTVQQQVVTLQVIRLCSLVMFCVTRVRHTSCGDCMLSLSVAARVHLYLWDAMVHVRAAKQPRSLTAARLGVGACLWDGAFVLTAYIAAQPVDTYAGGFLDNCILSSLSFAVHPKLVKILIQHVH